MPELPEVETVRKELETKIIGLKIINIETDWPKTFRNLSFSKFKKNIIGLSIKKIERKGKFIFFRLSHKKTLVAHLRMTGHFIVSTCWKFNGKQIEKSQSPTCSKKENDIFTDKKNTFIHTSFSLSNKKNLLLSDVRKFATIDLIEDEKLEQYKNHIGIDVLDKNLTFRLFNKLTTNSRREIKKTLLDQTLLSGIGNIYADEILFDSSVSPKKISSLISQQESEKIYKSMKKILKKALSLGGTSFSDFRNTDGKIGNYGMETKVYRKKGLPCPKKCGSSIKRITLAGRGTHYCPNCQR